jgi:hypothetical protein
MLSVWLLLLPLVLLLLPVMWLLHLFLLSLLSAWMPCCGTRASSCCCCCFAPF